MSDSTRLALAAHGLRRRYRGEIGKAATDALDGVDLVLKPGEALMLVGLNGAGKSTLLRLAAGLELPDEGKIRLFDESPRSAGNRRRVAYLPDGAELFPFLDARETLDFFGAGVGLDRAARRRETELLIEALDMKAFAKKRVGGYSTGMRRRLALATVLVGAPELLLLDEPAGGLDPEVTRLLLDALGREKERGATIVMASHHLAHAESFCDRIAVLTRGKIRFDGRLEDLAETIGARDVTLTGEGDPEGALRDAGFEASRLRVSESALEDFLIRESRS